MSARRRSGCPVALSLDLFGDRWSLLIIRDLMVRGYHTYTQFLTSGEGIASNILADRLEKLQQAGLVEEEADADDARKVNYRLTAKGIALAPVVLEMLIWGATHEKSGAPRAVIAQMERDREGVLREVHRRWERRDRTPYLPPFGKGGATSKGARKA